MRPASRDSTGKKLAIGCGSVLVLLMLFVIFFGAIVALERRREAEPIAIDHTYPIPQTGQIGTLVLDLEGVELAVVPGASGEPIRVTGGFDAAGFRLVTERSESDDGRWRYTLRLRPTSLLRFVTERDRGHEKMTVALPPDAAIFIEGNVVAGVSDLELGGLHIVALDMRLGAGDHRVAFSKPLVAPMRRMKIDSPMGELTLVELGNASPGEIRIDKKLGEACVDLRGAWRNDTAIEIGCGVGSCDLHRPLEGEATVRLAGELDPAADGRRPSLSVVVLGAISDRVEISPSLGE